jgi:bromodomain adjacent to zinc finger domain protein 1A
MSFYRLKQFQCEVTGKSGLDYFQAIESERHEARTLHSRFSEPLKPAVLKAVQWRASCSCSLSFNPVSPLIVTEVMGRLDHLVEAVYDRFKDRYFVGESVFALFLIVLCAYHVSRNRRRHIRNEVSLTDIQA